MNHNRDNTDYIHLGDCPPCEFTLKFVVLIGVAGAMFGILIDFCLRKFLKVMRERRSLNETTPDHLFRCYPVTHTGCLGHDQRHIEHGRPCPCQGGRYVPQQPPPYLPSAAEEGQNVGWSERSPTLLTHGTFPDCGGGCSALNGHSETCSQQQQHHQLHDHPQQQQQQQQESAVVSEDGLDLLRPPLPLLSSSPPSPPQEMETCSHDSRLTLANSTGSGTGHESRCHCSTSNLSPIQSHVLECEPSVNGHGDEANADIVIVRELTTQPEILASARETLAPTQASTTSPRRDSAPQANKDTTSSIVPDILPCVETWSTCDVNANFSMSPSRDVHPDAKFTSPHFVPDVREGAQGELVEMRIMRREVCRESLSDANLIATLTSAPPLRNSSICGSRDKNSLNDIESHSSHDSRTGAAPPQRRNVLEPPVPGFNRTSVFNFNTFPIVKDDKTISLPQPPEDEEGNEAEDERELTHVKDFIHSYIDDPFDPTPTSKQTMHNGKLIVYAMKALDYRGGELYLDYMGIALHVPEGALPKGPAHFVSLVLNWNLPDSPELDRRTALVGPVVYCGPHAMRFQKPCTLRFRHCAHDPRCVKILSSDTGLFDSMLWKPYCSTEVEDEQCETDFDGSHKPGIEKENMVNLTADECQVQVSHFSLYTCVQWAKHRRLKKWLQVAVFCRELDPAFEHHQFRVYFLNKTPCALQWALQNEAQHHFRLACPETTFLFEESGEDMRMALSYLSEGWEMVSSDNSVQFQHIWHGKCPHVCLAFRRAQAQSSLEQQRRKHGGSKLMINHLSTGNEDEIEDGVTSRVADTLPPRNRLLEINVDLKLCQERSENVVTHLNILAYEQDGGRLVHPEECEYLKDGENSPKQLQVCVSVEKETP